MSEWLRTTADLALEAIKREGVTPAGRVNIVVLLLALAATVTAGLTDLIQAVVRIFNSGYSTGLPSFLSMLVAVLVTLLACVAILAAADIGRRGS